MPEEVITISDEPEEDEQQIRRGSLDDDFDDDSTLPSASQEPIHETGFLSPRTIVSSLVQRNKSRLVHVVEKQERKAFEKLMMGPGTKKILKNAGIYFYQFILAKKFFHANFFAQRMKTALMSSPS